MEITDVRIRKIKTDSKMKAIVSITIEDCFVVHDIKVISGEKGLFVAMPSRRMGEGNYRDIAHPINSETRNLIEKEVFRVYNEELESHEKNQVISEESLSM